MLRVLLDSMCWDPLLDDPANLDALLELVEAGELEVVATHLQRDQLAATPNGRGWQLVTVLELVDPVTVPTAAFVVDVSALDEATLSDDETGELVTRLAGGSLDPRRLADALLAVTAQHGGATLVTGDARLRNACRREGVDVLELEAFLERLRASKR